MKLYVLDTGFNTVAHLDDYMSSIWTDRYCGYGDFEFYTSMDNAIFASAPKNYYLWSDISEHLMIIEERTITTDVESGNHLQITGRSLESILERRIIWVQTILTGNFQNGIQKLLNENVISPSIAARKIDNFIFESSDDPAITGLTIDAQFTGDNLYEAIVSLCSQNGLGFKITLNENNQFVFKLYKGSDRSYNQTENPYVVFSPDFENIVNSNYFESNQDYKNVALVSGEGEGSARKTSAVGDASGLERRELFVDARDISSETEEGTLTDEDYTKLLTQRGNNKLAEYKETTDFEGEVDTSQMFVYGEDFFIGDIVQITNEYGIEQEVRVDEMIFSDDTSQGITMIPTFTTV